MWTHLLPAHVALLACACGGPGPGATHHAPPSAQVAAANPQATSRPRDGCPDQHEGLGSLDADGRCADRDSDQDRIPDVHDQCPNEPEVYNGIEDEDGCPDRSVCFLGPTDPFPDRIYFAAGETRLPAPSTPVVDALAETLLAYPQFVEVAVVGHADSHEAHAHSLSRRRARSVTAALMQRGVPSGRLRPIAAGTSIPDTPDAAPGTAPGTGDRNRRVSFVVLRTDAGEVGRWDGERFHEIAPAP